MVAHKISIGSYAMPGCVKIQLAKAKAANIKQAATIKFQYFVIIADANCYDYNIYARVKF